MLRVLLFLDMSLNKSVEKDISSVICHFENTNFKRQMMWHIFLKEIWKQIFMTYKDKNNF